MDPLFVQNLRYKLQKRIGRLNSVEPGTFHFALIQFWRFFDEQPMFVGILGRHAGPGTGLRNVNR